MTVADPAERARLAASVKAADSPFTTYLVSPYSRYAARWAARRGLTPNQVTVASLGVGVLAAAAFATGDRWGLLTGAVLLQAAFVLDCVDGQLARYSGRLSPFGAWLDATGDRLKEYLVYGGLAVGAAHAGDPVWGLAGAALTVQTTSHLMGLAVAARADLPAAGPLRPAPMLRRVAYFPIGERLAALSLAAALWDARVALTVVLVGASFGTLYGLAGRVRRSW